MDEFLKNIEELKEDALNYFTSDYFWNNEWFNGNQYVNDPSYGPWESGWGMAQFLFFEITYLNKLLVLNFLNLSKKYKKLLFFENLNNI